MFVSRHVRHLLVVWWDWLDIVRRLSGRRPSRRVKIRTPYQQVDVVFICGAHAALRTERARVPLAGGGELTV